MAAISTLSSASALGYYLPDCTLFCINLGKCWKFIRKVQVSDAKMQAK